MNEHVVVMGVSGTGKSTVGRLLAERLGAVFVEGDDLHPAANVASMRAGIPLTDEQRAPWLEAVRDAMDGPGTVVACSALRRRYRDVLRGADGRVRFVHLVVAPDELARRLGQRAGHFMPASLLASQLATLEPLEPDEDGIDVVVADSVEATADAVIKALTTRS